MTTQGQKRKKQDEKENENKERSIRPQGQTWTHQFEDEVFSGLYMSKGKLIDEMWKVAGQAPIEPEIFPDTFEVTIEYNSAHRPTEIDLMIPHSTEPPTPLLHLEKGNPGFYLLADLFLLAANELSYKSTLGDDDPSEIHTHWLSTDSRLELFRTQGTERAVPLKLVPRDIFVSYNDDLKQYMLYLLGDSEEPSRVRGDKDPLFAISLNVLYLAYLCSEQLD